MVDLHIHVLPGIDDGPADLGESIALARKAERDGVHAMVATPHLRMDFPGVVPGELAGRCEELNRVLAAEGVHVTVVPGAEIDVGWATDALDDELRLASLAQRGDWLLLETPYGPLPHHFEELLFGLEVRGYRIVLAHPERNPTFQSDPRRVEALAERGTLLQLTAASLAGGRRSRSRRLAARLVRSRVAHVIASDAHGPARFERLALSAGRDAATVLAPERADWMVSDAPGALLAGEYPTPPPAPARGALASLRRRFDIG